jgi:predicted permease
MRAFMFGVLFLASLVLLVACANLASVMLARGDERRRELAIRGAIGAGRWRLFRQLTTESAMLAAGGGVLGCAVAMASAELLSRLQLSTLPIALDVRVDLRVLVFAVFTSLVAIVLFGLMPARRAVKMDPYQALKNTSVHVAGRWGLRHVIVVIQIALCFAMVSASLMSLQGLRRILEQPLGFQPENLYTALFDPSGYDRAAGTSFRNRLLEEVRRVPGVTGAAYVSALPLSTDQSTTTVFSESEAKDPTARGHEASYRWASKGFFATAGVRLVAGRDFTDDDVRDRPRVAIVNETFVREVWHVPAAQGVGRRYFNFGRTVPVSVVGVIADGKYRTPTESPLGALFEPLSQVDASDSLLVVRSASASTHILPAIRRAAAAIDPQLPLIELGPASDQFTLTFLPSRAAAIALNVFGSITLILATTGVQGLLALIVTKQRRELAIRAAIGAAPSDLVQSVARPLAQCLAAGAAAGVLLSLGVGRVLKAVVFNVSSMEPWLLIAAAMMVLLMGTLAGLAPAVKALRANPVEALLAE